MTIISPCLTFGGSPARAIGRNCTSLLMGYIQLWWLRSSDMRAAGPVYLLPHPRAPNLHAVHCYAGADGARYTRVFQKAACAAVTSAAIMDPACNALGCTTGWREGIHQPPHCKWYCLRVGLGLTPYAARSTDSRRVRAKRRRNSGRILTSRTSESSLTRPSGYKVKL